MFLRNCWYVAAWSSEAAGELLGRRILNEPVLIYRLNSGAAAAIGNRCPHRFAPLAMGRQVDDTIQCGYHGLRFGADGRCVENPNSGGHIPSGTAVKAYPLVERNRLLWIWMGDPDQADPDLIPDMGFLTRPPNAGAPGGYLHVDADYRLSIDNLMDLSHAAFVHEQTLGRLTPALADGRLEVRREGDSIVAAILMRGVRVPIAAGPVDQWLDITWQAPAVTVVDIGHVEAGAPRPAHGHLAMHVLTPETERTTHYFFSNTSAPMTFSRNPFSDEDAPMLAACQTMMGEEDFWALRPVILPNDAGGVRVRRELDRLIRAEVAA